MIAVSATCVAILRAHKAGNLRFTENVSRFGGTYIAICDDHGIIEVADDMSEAESRLAALLKRMA